MSGQQTPISKGRKFSEVSPDLEENSSKKQCQNSEKMDQELRNFMKEMRDDKEIMKEMIKEIKNEVTMLHDKMNELSQKVDSRIEKIESDVKQISEDIIEIRAEIFPIEERTAELSKKIQLHDTDINSINQNALKNQLVMINIAPSINEEQFLEAMNRWTFNLTNDALNNVKLLKVQASQTAILDFLTMIHKRKFLEFIRGKQKDQAKKYIPILNEHIFELPETDIHRANIIEFRTAMTKMNREIFNKARDYMKLHNLIEGVWIANGAVYMRVKKVSKPYRLNTLEELEDLMGSMALARRK